MISKIFLLLLMCIYINQSFAEPGSFFQVTPQGNAVIISTVVPNKTYFKAGLQILSPGYHFGESDCDSIVGDTCLFSVSDVVPRTISLSGESSLVNLKLCLNGVGHITCQTYQSIVNNNIVTVGALTPSGGSQNGVVYTSSNGGQSWTSPLIVSPAENSIADQLNAVSCDTSNNFCTAAGFYLLANDDEAPVVYTSSDGGQSWGSPLLPQTLPHRTEILGLDCSSDGQLCQAVGYNLDTRNIPIIYTATNSNWDGLAGQIPPEPSGAASLYSRVNSVSCTPSGEKCVAVGWHQDNIQGFDMPYTLYTTNGGVTWNLGQQPLLPAGYGTGVTFGVSCSSQGTHCVAVGFVTLGDDPPSNAGPRKPISFFSNNGGLNWSNAVFPELPTSSGATQGLLVDVSCGLNGLVCTAVGRYITEVYTPGDPDPIEQTYNLTYRTNDGGKTWSAPSLPTVLANSTSNTLSSVTCSATGSICTTVGRAKDSDLDIPISYTTTNGTDWGPVVVLPRPQGATGFLQSVTSRR